MVMLLMPSKIRVEQTLRFAGVWRQKTFARTAAYDSAISGWMATSLGEDPAANHINRWPENH
jgi:AICAR transformylase/IMP cyclohydrolase PurH